MNQQHKREIKYSSDNGHPWEEDAKEPLQAEVRQAAAEPLRGVGEFICGRSLKWYQEVAVWPMFILLVAEISLRVMQSRYFLSWPEQIFSGLISLVRVASFVYLTVTAFKNYQATRRQALTAAVLGGLVAGVLLAVFQLLWYFELWTFFNLIGQPLLLAAAGLVISWIIARLFFKNR